MVDGEWKMPEAEHNRVTNVTDMPVYQLYYQLTINHPP